MIGGRPVFDFIHSCHSHICDLSLHNLTYEDAIEMALDKPLWGLLAASGATH